MVLLVDFNMREPDGRLPALLIDQASRELPLGAQVVASDGEGVECTAVVSEVSRDGRYVMLQTIGGTFRESDYAPLAGDIFA